MMTLPALLVVAGVANAAAPAASDGFSRDLGLIRAAVVPSFAGLQERLEAAPRGDLVPEEPSERAIAAASPAPPATPEEAREAVWARLEGSGVPRSFVDAAFADPRVAVLREVEERFGRPSESLPYERYRRIFITPARIEAGRRFLREAQAPLEDVSGRYTLDGGLLAALVGVESFYGTASGRIPVFNALYTAVLRVPKRSVWATKELAEFLRLAHEDSFDPHSVNGSYAGAFGWAQFIPSSFRAYAVDHDGDGRRRWDDWPDVLAAAANYLKSHGYEPGGAFDPGSKNWWAIYAYNHSESYVKVVLELRREIQSRVPSS